MSNIEKAKLWISDKKGDWLELLQHVLFVWAFQVGAAVALAIFGLPLWVFLYFALTGICQ